MNRNVKVWVVGVVLAVLLVGGTYFITSSLVSGQMTQAPQAKPEVWERVAVALERIATAMEKSAGGSRMMGGMMQGMGQMQGMMGPMQAMMNDQSKISCATSWLEKALKLHELHMKDPATTTEESQKELMDQIKKAHECLTGTQGAMSGMMGQMGSMMQACQQMMEQMQGMMGGPMVGHTPAALSEAELMRTSEAAGITVKVTFLNPLLKPEAEKLIFKVALDTHTVDLSQLDLTKLAVLRTGEGVVVNKGFTWEPESESSHHRAGLLKLDATFEGKPLITKDTKYIELEMKEVGVPSRIFKWTKQEQR